MFSCLVEGLDRAIGVNECKIPLKDRDDFKGDVLLAVAKEKDLSKKGFSWAYQVCTSKVSDYWRHSKEVVEMPENLGSSVPNLALLLQR